MSLTEMFSDFSNIEISCFYLIFFNFTHNRLVLENRGIITQITSILIFIEIIIYDWDYYYIIYLLITKYNTNFNCRNVVKIKISFAFNSNVLISGRFKTVPGFNLFSNNCSLVRFYSH